MTAINGASIELLANYTRNDTVVTEKPSSNTAIAGNNTAAAMQNASSTTVTLSNQAKTYLAGGVGDSSAGSPSAADLASNARTWFDQQYKQLGISSATIGGKTAVDLSSQSRATLAVVASNGQGLFTKDEVTAATNALQSRFDEALSSSVVVARHTGDYGSLYGAALKYMAAAGPDEKATATWKAQDQALVSGAALARRSFGKAPDTGDANDPVRTLLGKSASYQQITPATSTTSVAANARAMLDDQANSAKDAGKQLTFGSSARGGQQVDFSKFDNRSLAVVALNQGAGFSTEESRAAKGELDQRYRTSALKALSTTTGQTGSTNGSFGLLQLYSGMSSEEKSALGVSASITRGITDSYRTQLSVQQILGGKSGLGLAAYI